MHHLMLELVLWFFVKNEFWDVLEFKRDGAWPKRMFKNNLRVDT